MIYNPNCLKKKYIGMETSDPTVSDDETKGYKPGDECINSSSGEVFYLIDTTVGSADWRK